jgi:hypothetical protein
MQSSLKNCVRQIVLGSAVCFAALVYFSVPAGAQIPAGWEASNMRAIGYSDLDGRGGAFKMAIKRVGDRWYMYLGHLWHRGWSIVDVTDPANPRVAKFIPGPDNTWTIQIDLHDNLMLTALEKSGARWGLDPNKPQEEGVLFWDVSDPLNPVQLSHWKTGDNGTHRNGYPGGRYANLAARQPGYDGEILIFMDVSDPRNPKEAGRWWMPGQKEGEPRLTQGVAIHGPAMIEGNRAYVGYGSSVVILDISNIAAPKLIGKLDYSPPFRGGDLGVHSVQPIPGRNLLFATSEGTGGDAGNAPACNGPMDHSSLVDISNPARPRLISIFPVPVPPASKPYKTFCAKGARFGPHNTNTLQHLPDVEKQGDLIYLTYFNAGLRIYDIKEQYLPKEVGWFIPPTPTQRVGPIPTPLESQVEDVLVDTRGNIYITDKQWGLWVLRYTGMGQPAPTAR